MIEDLLTADCAVAEAFDDSAAVALFPQEAALMEGRVARRRRQFATGRSCARRALGRLGVPPAPLLPGPGGAPVWPQGVVGSITHCDGYLAAAVAPARAVAAVGIDAEPALPLPEGVLSLVAGPEEQEALSAFGTEGAAACRDRLLFSAKEAVYKAWYPRARRWSALREIRVVLDPGGTFTARPPARGPAGAAQHDYSGRWLVRSGLLLAAVLEPAPAGHPSRLFRLSS
ncbi:4'-phosphopantetheinyl transferase family protein [Streptomonospora litoralis]|uniref:4'-phosphopantetheinyl transferase Npt n=1 Tax=Streptomonospora litoralis TaxID=2498135 RepID=A0A4P6Q2W6_9ACTN|nr:4'-phosphopantetheinyl transferase superfamily protein [Streptomonospora litoralis]QBI54915.1 4'-phosphopantetheinyl transferase Npt [Streptomonospora litoralis]